MLRLNLALDFDAIGAEYGEVWAIIARSPHFGPNAVAGLDFRGQSDDVQTMLLAWGGHGFSGDASFHVEWSFTRRRNCVHECEVENGMTKVVEQSGAADVEPKKWATPALEKVEMNDTAGGTAFGSRETLFPGLRPS